jgi:anti-sigma factor RsiW
MNCHDCIALISRRLSGLISEPERQELERHLSECSACRAELRLQQRIHEALSEPVPPVLADDFAERVMRRALAEARREGRARTLGYLLPVFANAAALILVILYSGQIARALAPSFGAIGEGVAAGFAWLGNGVGEALRGMGRTESRAGGLVGQAASQAVWMWGTTAAAVGLVGWALSRAYTFLRK